MGLSFPGALIGSAFGPIGTIVGGALGGLGDTFLQTNAQREANETNVNLAREQMAFQERMAGTAHQRAMNDLRSSGLNPLMALNTSAATPAGATAQVKSVMEGVSSSGLEIARYLTDLEKQKKEIGLLEAQQKATDATRRRTDVESKVLEKEIPRSDLYNRGYKLVEPLMDKIEEGTKSKSLKKLHQEVAPPSEEELQKRKLNDTLLFKYLKDQMRLN